MAKKWKTNKSAEKAETKVFRSSKSQAEKVAKKVSAVGAPSHGRSRGKVLRSLGSKRSFEQSVKTAADWLKAQGIRRGIEKITPDEARQYLTDRAAQVGQKQLDRDRQALQVITGEKFERLKSEVQHIAKSRAYTPEQMRWISDSQNERNGLATRIADAAGLRAHELHTLRRVEERAASRHRTWSRERFAGIEGARYTVVGKGGLVREVVIPTDLARELESRRLSEPVTVRDREIHYTKTYDIGGGNAWSKSASDASKRAFGWSNGAHGFRHAYAQRRMADLQQMGYPYERALGIVSQELGHFRPDITEVYLR